MSLPRPESSLPSTRQASSQAFFSQALSPLAQTLSVAALALGGTFAQAQTDSTPRELPKLVAGDTADPADNKVDTVSSPKFTQALINTPQTLTVVPQVVLQQQGASTLIEALRNTPGITMQLGENGSTSAGDAFSIRGTASQTNVFVDGVRDVGTMTRDIFNTSQVEIAKGAVGADFGRGTTAGYVNTVTKQAQLGDSINVGLLLNSAPGSRVTGDLNTRLSGGAALRFNTVWENSDVAGRDYVKNKHWGVAPSLALGLGSATRAYVYSQHLRADNVPDGGIPTIGMDGFYHSDLNGRHAAAVNTKNFYGRDDDYEKASVDMGTVRIEHDFSHGGRLINTTRLGRSDIKRVMTGINTLTLTAANPSDWTVARIRQSLFQENRLLTNQTNFNVNASTGFIQHDLAMGVEFIEEQQFSPTWTGFGSVPAYLNGGTAYNPAANLYSPNAHFAYTAPGVYSPRQTGAYSDGKTRTYAGYVFDTLTFTPQWLLTAGARFEHYKTQYDGVSFDNTTGARTASNLESSDDLLSWKTGVIFKPLPGGSIYLAYSNSLTPPGSSNFSLSSSTSETNTNNPSLEAQEARHLELGTKWDLLNARLAVNAALYRTENRNELSVVDSVSGAVEQYGKRRVEGGELGITGALTASWQVIAGFAWTNSEVIEGTRTAANGSTANNNRTGATSRWTPPYSANLWTTYTHKKLMIGTGANYTDTQKRVVDETLVAPQNGLSRIPSFTVWNAMASYRAGEHLNVQLNVDNLLNKQYINELNNSGMRARLGTPRTAQLTGTFSF